MPKQGHNYLYGTIQEISGLFETQVKTLEAPAPTVNTPYKKKKKMKKMKKMKKLNYQLN